MQLELAIALLMAKVVTDMHADGRASAVQPLQWSILRFLTLATSVPKDLKSIASYLATTTSSIEQAVNKLERLGLVARGSDPRIDGSAHIEITEDGKIALAEDPMQKLARKIGALTDNEREGLAKALRKLLLMESKLGANPQT